MFTAEAAFLADYRRLDRRERELFSRAIRLVNDAYSRRGADPLPRWPSSLRVKAVRGAPGMWEMTWAFAGPDGRAAFEIVTIDEESAIKWRRIGGHGIFDRPSSSDRQTMRHPAPHRASAR